MFFHSRLRKRLDERYDIVLFIIGSVLKAPVSSIRSVTTNGYHDVSCMSDIESREFEAVFVFIAILSSILDHVLAASCCCSSCSRVDVSICWISSVRMSKAIAAVLMP